MKNSWKWLLIAQVLVMSGGFYFDLAYRDEFLSGSLSRNASSSFFSSLLVVGFSVFIGFAFSRTLLRAFLCQFLLCGGFAAVLSFIRDGLTADFRISMRLANMAGASFQQPVFEVLFSFLLMMVVFGLGAGFAAASGYCLRRYLLRPVSMADIAPRDSRLNRF